MATLNQLQKTLFITYAVIHRRELDKFTNLLTNWSDYLGANIKSALPMDPLTFMKISRCAEVVSSTYALGLGSGRPLTRLTAAVAEGGFDDAASRRAATRCSISCSDTYRTSSSVCSTTASGRTMVDRFSAVSPGSKSSSRAL